MFKHNEYRKSGELLFDYYEAVTGLPIEPGYDEITLTATEDQKKLRMDVYSRPRGNGEKESRATYTVSSEALDKSMKLVKKHKMSRWNKHGSIGLCGKMYVCKFWLKNEFIRVSSDSMPKNGQSVFHEIHSTLISALNNALEAEGSSEKFSSNIKTNIKKNIKEKPTEYVASLKVLHTHYNTMEFSPDGCTYEPKPHSEPVLFSVKKGEAFLGFTVTEVSENSVTFVSDLERYAVNNGDIEKQFTVYKAESLSLNMIDIMDATDITLVELTDITEADK